MPYPASCDYIPCVTWYNQGKVFFFSMELSAQQKNQAYHVCRVGKKWLENHGQALFFFVCLCYNSSTHPTVEQLRLLDISSNNNLPSVLLEYF